VNLESIRSALHAQPFQPFELCLADGRRLPVTHPEFVAMTNRIVMVLAEDSSFKVIEPLLIVSLESASVPGKGDNGRHKKRPKS